MQQGRTRSSVIWVGTMLFGMFFGAGNLIFPISLGQAAGTGYWPALLGLFITAVLLPFLGVLAIGVSGTGGVLGLADRVHPWYSRAFTVALYLTIGPLFAIPRTATVPFVVGIEPLLSGDQTALYQGIFSLIFFAIVCYHSLRPARILDIIGKWLTPIFLTSLLILAAATIVKPIGPFGEPQGAFAQGAFAAGFKEGYNTMDALASLAFGIVVIRSIEGLGMKEPRQVAKVTALAGAFAMLLMIVIYGLIAYMGASSVSSLGRLSNGGQVFGALARHYFGSAGGLLLGMIFVFACLKTSIALITSCSAFFHELFPRLSYRLLAVLLCLISFVIANFGLSNIITYAVPVLMLLYPPAIVLILLALASPLYGHRRWVYRLAILFTLAVSLIDGYGELAASLPGFAIPVLDSLRGFYKAHLPLYAMGLGWLLPALAGSAIGLLIPSPSAAGEKAQA